MKYIFAVIFLLFCTNLQAQTKDDAKHFSGWLYMDNNKPKIYKSAENNDNVEEILLSHLFLFYKKYISSQDKNTCTFLPTCSEYALQSIKKEGLILGVLSGFDRISRCQHLSPENYPVYPHTHLLYDPVE